MDIRLLNEEQTELGSLIRSLYILVHESFLFHGKPKTHFGNGISCCSCFFFKFPVELTSRYGVLHHKGLFHFHEILSYF